jgi:hypothetical protein
MNEIQYPSLIDRFQSLLMNSIVIIPHVYFIVCAKSLKVFQCRKNLIILVLWAIELATTLGFTLVII